MTPTRDEIEDAYVDSVIKEDELTKEGTINITGWIWNGHNALPEGEREQKPAWREIQVVVKIQDLEDLGYKKVD